MGSSRLHGKVAIVTGGGQGIGRGVAMALAEDGASVAVVGRTLSKCQAVAKEITSAGGDAIAMECDVSSRQQMDAVVAGAVEAYGGVDIVVNNAQSAVQRPLTEITDDDVADLFQHWGAATLGYQLTRLIRTTVVATTRSSRPASRSSTRHAATSPLAPTDTGTATNGPTRPGATIVVVS